MLDRDGAAARRRILYISRSMMVPLFTESRALPESCWSAAVFLPTERPRPRRRRRRINTRNAEADAAAARRRGAVAFDLALPAREAGLAQQLWCGFAHDL